MTVIPVRLPDEPGQHPRRRHRRRRALSFGESGIGWIPYALDRMHFEWEDRFRDGVWPESSTYIAEQFGHLPFAG